MVTLSEVGKRAVIAFYPAAFTGVCTKEMCTLTDSLQSLKEANAAIFGISADNVFANAEFAKVNEIGFPLLCDVNRSAIFAYDLAIEDFGAPGYTASHRAVFIVEEDGTVSYAWVADNPGIEPDYDEIASFCSN